MDEARPYLCGPIDHVSYSEASTWREEMKERFPKALDPMRREYPLPTEQATQMIELDKKDILECNFVICKLTSYGKTPLVGTSMELIYAWTMGKPVIVWKEPGMRISPWIAYHCMAQVTSEEELLEVVRRILA